MSALTDREHAHHIVAAALLAPWVVCGLGLAALWVLKTMVARGNVDVCGAEDD